MTDEQLNIAICEWRGWKDCHKSLASNLEGPIAERYLIGIAPDSVIHSRLPSHILGIEALGNMHEAEKGLSAKYLLFDGDLARIVHYDWLHSDLTGHEKNHAESYPSHASARQRAIALLRVVKPEIFPA